MFWDKAFAPSQNIELLLAKENVTVEEFLEEDDILHECKNLKPLTIYFTQSDVIKRLVELITTEPPEDLPLSHRFRHANMACEVLTMGLPSLHERLLSDPDTLKILYSYLEKEPPLHPLLSSFFSKTFSMLFTKKQEQDWFLYQQMCLKLLEYIKSQNNFVDLICKHFSTPVVPDLTLQMMRDVDGDVGNNLYQWLTEEKLVERLIDMLGDSKEVEKHENIAEFLCDLIEHGRSMRTMGEQENLLLRNLESNANIEKLINVILDPNAVQGSIDSGIPVVLTLIKSITEDERVKLFRRVEEEEKTRGAILSTVISVVLPRINDFNELLKNPPKKTQSVLNAAQIQDPFGNTRLQVIRLFRTLLEMNCEMIVEAICETDFFETIMQFFKKYYWNNFLHSEVQKFFSTIFDKRYDDKSSDHKSEDDKSNDDKSNDDNSSSDGLGLENCRTFSTMFEYATNSNDQNDPDKVRAIQKLQNHVIGKCKIISRLLECWKLNEESEKAEKKRRLGFMGHLIQILKELNERMEHNESLRNLIEANLTDEEELVLWLSITNKQEGQLQKILEIQSSSLANYYALSNFSGNMFLTETDDWGGDVRHFNVVADDDIINYNDNLDNVLESKRNDEIGNYFESGIVNVDTMLSSNDSNDIAGTQMSSEDITEANTNDVNPNVFWKAFNEDFADFDAHFESFISDIVESLDQTSTPGLTSVRTTSKYFDHTNENDDNHQGFTDNDFNNGMLHAFKDNNANLEKLTNLEGASVNNSTNCDKDLVTYESILSGEKNQPNMEVQDSSSFDMRSSPPPQQQPKEENQNKEFVDQITINEHLNFDYYDDYDDDEGMWTKPLGPPSIDTSDTDIHEKTKNGPLDVASLPPELKADIITNQQLIEASEQVNKPFEFQSLGIVQNSEKLNSLNDLSGLIKNKFDTINITENALNDLKLDNSNLTESDDNITTITTTTTTTNTTNTNTSSSPPTTTATATATD